MEGAMVDEDPSRARDAEAHRRWCRAHPDVVKQQSVERTATYREHHPDWAERRRQRDRERRAARTPEQRAKDAAYNRQWREANMDRVRSYRSPDKDRARRHARIASDPEGTRLRDFTYRIKRKFGLTIEQYRMMLDAQGGVCAICRQPETAAQRGAVMPLAIDHDRACCPGERSCGRCIRALLCIRCNMVLGGMKDDPGLLRAAAAYLEDRAA